jgi:hypothetical protein
MDIAQSYKVLYTKDGNKKRKIFHEGSLIVKKSVGSSCTTILWDEHQQELRKSTDNSTSKSYSSGDEFMFGIYLIQIEEVTQKAEEVENSIINTPVPTRSLPQGPPTSLGRQPFKTPRPLAPMSLKTSVEPIPQVKEENQDTEERPLTSTEQPIIGRSSNPAFRTGSTTASILQASRVNRPSMPFRVPTTRPVVSTQPSNIPASEDKQQQGQENESSVDSSSINVPYSNYTTIQTPHKPLLTSKSTSQPNISTHSDINPSISRPNSLVQNTNNPFESVESKKVNVAEIVLDRLLQKVMKEHQITGANFLLDCIIRKPFSPSQDLHDDDEDEDTTIKSGGETNEKRSSKICWSDSEDEGENKSHRTSLVQATAEREIHGAILADEMGLGKTLTTISVLWTLISLQICKVVIVCPSSLIDNWCAEIKKWLGMRLAPLVIRAGSDVNAIINTFAISRITKFPLLILSYEVLLYASFTIVYHSFFSLLETSKMCRFVEQCLPLAFVDL